MNGHVGVNLRKEVMAEVDEFVSKGARGHTSRADLISDAVRHYVDELRREERLNKKTTKKFN